MKNIIEPEIKVYYLIDFLRDVCKYENKNEAELLIRIN